MKLYINSAKYFKVGQNIWVDRTFSQAVLNGTYHFHASVSAFAEFWNTSFWSTQMTTSKKVSRRQVWQAFVQESVRKVASASHVDLELPDKLPIDEVTKQAFKVIGEEGVIRAAEGHACSECTHEYKKEADEIPQADDPAALVGIDENRNVPAFVGDDDDGEMNRGEMEHRLDSSSEDEPMDVDGSSDVENPQSDTLEEITEHSPVHMVVLMALSLVPSTVHLKTALLISRIIKQEYFVQSMRGYVGTYVVCKIVRFPKLLVLRHVINIEKLGVPMLYVLVVQLCWGSGGC
jgi:hypothetical protein